jgi:hypothetical protein
VSDGDDIRGRDQSASTPRCFHLWQPYADTKHIYQKCVHCGEERHGPTHQEMLMENLAYIFRDVDE